MVNDFGDKEDGSLGASLSLSIAGEGVDLVASLADTLIDSAISSGALDGVPIVGMLVGGARTIGEVRDHLYLRKILRFLSELNSTPKDRRESFVRSLQGERKLEYFGETVLLILDRMDDSIKPKIVGRILAAHISGDIESFDKTMRLVAIVNRVYAADFTYLRSFCPGVQNDEDVAASLFAAGLLANTGFDGGGADQAQHPGGYTYDLNEYGRLLVAHGLK